MSAPYGQMTGWENFWWITLNVVLLGWPYFRKLTLKRAMIEALNAHDQVVYRAAHAIEQHERPQL